PGRAVAPRCRVHLRSRSPWASCNEKEESSYDCATLAGHPGWPHSHNVRDYMRHRHWTTCAAVAALGLAALPTAAMADTSGTLFESPAFAPGDINGQHGWMNVGGYDAAIVANTGATAGVFGQQSLRISNAIASGSFGDQTFSPALTDGAGEPTSADGGHAGGMRQ